LAPSTEKIEEYQTIFGEIADGDRSGAVATDILDYRG
jgi:hypothetical protein